MKLKLDEAGHAVLQDGNPVYVHDDGKELPFDALAAHTKIRELNGESMGRRKELQELRDKIAAFDGLDPAAARDALDKLGKIDAKKLVDAGEIDKVRAEIKASVEAAYKPHLEERDMLRGELEKERIGGAFSRSKFIAEKVISPAVAEALFRDKIKLEGGQVVAYDAKGQKIYSRARPGELADFEEAIETLVSSFPDRDTILKAPPANGMGVKPSGGGGGTGKTITKDQFDAMSPKERAAAMASGATIAPN